MRPYILPIPISCTYIISPFIAHVINTRSPTNIRPRVCSVHAALIDCSREEGTPGAKCERMESSGRGCGAGNGYRESLHLPNPPPIHATLHPGPP
ncbi:uncharacterized protein BDW47DRAFT_103718 [Aspergillus candidus]|uniref:Uncharacterized protein n=1 Tax=Aspergillus candidus TaxID=41067 RepID=A0A2I2FES2_ASPCN|nr:hypothetical protein BDW47DRAFT_103718 [Aspergillus candidus]PLB39117.1 hypothetical protein BDW47DRAFT_103718 [Aspergillus candidus]